MDNSHPSSHQKTRPFLSISHTRLSLSTSEIAQAGCKGDDNGGEEKQPGAEGHSKHSDDRGSDNTVLDVRFSRNNTKIQTSSRANQPNFLQSILRSRRKDDCRSRKESPIKFSTNEHGDQMDNSVKTNEDSSVTTTDQADHADRLLSPTPPLLIRNLENRRCKEKLNQEEIQPLNLFIENLKSDLNRHKQRQLQLQLELQYCTQHNQELESKLAIARSTGLKLEATNGRFIAESMKHKYLKTESRQLTAELTRRRMVLEAKETEKRELMQDFERLQSIKSHCERQCQEAVLESNITAQQLKDVREKCQTMEFFKDDKSQVRKMMYNLQNALGRVRVFASLKPTVHESCIQFLSSSKILFHLPAREQQNKSKSRGFDEVPVLCKLSHVMPPGSCSPLELYNEVSTTIDGVVDGLNACFTTVGPKNSGKSMTLFGEPVSCVRPNNSSSRIKGASSFRQRQSQFHQLFSTTTNATSFTELFRSNEFASLYGFLGLCLVHLLQDINIKTIIDTTATVCQQSVYREYKISLATILVPLDSEQPEFDLLANQPVNFTKSSLLTETHTDPTLFLLELEHQEIASLVDVVQVCELIQRRIRHGLLARGRRNSAPVDMAHKIVLVKVQTRSNIPVTERIFNTGGLLLLIDTVGLQDELKGHTVPGWENKPCISIQAWRDVAALIQAMRLKPKPHNFERTRLLRLIKPGLLSWDKPRLQTNSTTACSVLLHLPCDASQAYLTMQCLRLGMWAMHLDRERAASHCRTCHSTSEQDVPGSNECGQSGCTWMIGTVGQSQSANPTRIRSSNIHRTNSLLGWQNRTHSSTITAQNLSKSTVGLQRTCSLG
ncbi:hypothetical protein T265_11041 [Opisthorchis viverrini]|uniref:Spindle pole body-associated protein Vik1/Cik1 microtubule binding domain-containing protein n=1 Tax=Opisthorchis viverrini TaxID=6198 RepID=A0A074Z4E1_OPIVI|nr:hypothetical protein T265_11041 [Opisthorchis viverrini]KER20392.1 hypothetical protein T265_11041 [Opisthorchis viverrini]